MKPDVLIVGAGPVGLVLAQLLQPQKRSIHIYEKRSSLPDCSMAIGITPPSLAILQQLGLRDAFETRGIHIRKARVFENREPVGSLGFEQAGDHILSLPQAQTLEILKASASALPNVTLYENTPFTLSTPIASDTLVIGCDGGRSTVRERTGISFRYKAYRQKFVMADFEDIEQAGPDARLFFSPRGSVESFPLPDGLRRWVAQLLPGDNADIDHIGIRVQDAAGVDLSGVAHGPPSPFTPKRALARKYHQGQFILCGDAAHQLSPIGGQGMNTGFADAFYLAEALSSDQPGALDDWERQRKKAFNHAATRAAVGMRFGTLTGVPASRIRARVLKSVLHQPHASKLLSRSYAMLNLPHPVQT